VTIDSLLRRASKELAGGNLRESHRLLSEILQLEPRHPEAHYLLAVNCLQRRQVGKSIVLLKVACGLKPKEGRYWVQLARAYSQSEQIAEAEQALDHAFALSPVDAMSVDTLGVVLSRMGDHKRAESYFRQSLKRQPQNPDFLFNLATSLRFNGKLEEAYHCFQDLYRSHPERSEIFPTLAELAPGDSLEKMRAAFEKRLTNEHDVDARLQISHGLARILERLDKASVALETLIEANQQKRQSIAYDSNDDEHLFDGLTQLCTPAFCRQGSTVESGRPIFIVGMPRSGTTLLERIFSSHSEVHASGELQDFAIGFKRLGGSQTQGLLDLDTVSAGGRINYEELGKRYLAQTQSRSGKLAHFIDKMPLNFLYAGLIHKALPGARIICLRRNPMDTVLSNFRQLFAIHFSQYNYAYDLLDIARYYLLFDKLMSHWEVTLPADIFRQVHYESVVDDTEAQARSIIDFLNLPWEDECLDFHRNEAPVATASAVQVRQPIYRSSVGRWKTVEAQLEDVKSLFTEAGINV
jgi:Flp pilus assembly protein TadD